MRCVSCGKTIKDFHYAAVINFINGSGVRVRKYLCRGSDDLGCAEELLGNEMPEVLEAVPPLGASPMGHRVIEFPGRPLVSDKG